MGLLNKCRIYFFGAGGEVLPGAVGLFPLFPPDGFPVLLGAFAGEFDFAILLIVFGLLTTFNVVVGLVLTLSIMRKVYRILTFC